MHAARPFRRDEALRADERARFVDVGDQPNVRQLGRALDEDDVRRLDIPVHEVLLVQVVERGGQVQPDLQRLGIR